MESGVGPRTFLSWFLPWLFHTFQLLDSSSMRRKSHHYANLEFITWDIVSKAILCYISVKTDNNPVRSSLLFFQVFFFFCQGGNKPIDSNLPPLGRSGEEAGLGYGCVITSSVLVPQQWGPANGSPQARPGGLPLMVWTLVSPLLKKIFFKLFLLFKYLFILFGCASSSFWHVGSLLAACELLVVAYKI